MSGEGDFIALPCSHQGNVSVAPLWCALQGLPCGLPAVGAGPVTWEHGGFYLLAAFSNTDAHSPSLPPCFLTFPPPQESCFLPQRRSAATSSSIPHLSEWASRGESKGWQQVWERRKGLFPLGPRVCFLLHGECSFHLFKYVIRQAWSVINRWWAQFIWGQEESLCWQAGSSSVF